MCPYLNIFRNLYGVDISHSSVLRAKILLALLALSNGEYAKEEDFNIEQGNSLLYDFLSRENVKTNGGFDLIVGNPPYVRSKTLRRETNNPWRYGVLQIVGMQTCIFLSSK